MKIAFIAILIGIVVIGGLIFFGRGSEKPVAEKPTSGTRADKAPDFRLKDYDGNEVALADFAGKNIIVNSWAVWCPFCVKELKDFAELFPKTKQTASRTLLFPEPLGPKTQLKLSLNRNSVCLAKLLKPFITILFILVPFCCSTVICS